MKSFGRLYEEASTAERLRNQHTIDSRWWVFWDRVRQTLQDEGDRAVERMYPKGIKR